jgi:hypothetical protein
VNPSRPVSIYFLFLFFYLLCIGKREGRFFLFSTFFFDVCGAVKWPMFLFSGFPAVGGAALGCSVVGNTSVQDPQDDVAISTRIDCSPEPNHICFWAVKVSEHRSEQPRLLGG